MGRGPRESIVDQQLTGRVAVVGLGVGLVVVLLLLVVLTVVLLLRRRMLLLLGVGLVVVVG